MNSRMLLASASTGRILQPVSWRRRSIVGSDCGSAIATVSVSRTLNIGRAVSRSASSSPISVSRAGSIRPWRNWQPGTPSCCASSRSMPRAVDQALLDEHLAEHAAARPLLVQQPVELLRRDGPLGHEGRTQPGLRGKLCHRKLLTAELVSS